MTLIFQLTKKEDLKSLAQIYNEAIKKGGITASVAQETATSFETFLAKHQKNRPMYTLFIGNEIVGYCSLSDFYGRDGYQNTAEVSLYLREKTQGQGLGYQALLFLEKEARKIGITTLLAFIFTSNQKSIHLFEKNGYKTYGQLPQVAQMNNKNYDLAILGKKL